MVNSLTFDISPVVRTISRNRYSLATTASRLSRVESTRERRHVVRTVEGYIGHHRYCVLLSFFCPTTVSVTSFTKRSVDHFVFLTGIFYVTTVFGTQRTSGLRSSLVVF